MKWMVLLSTVLLAACSFNDPDEVAYQQVVVAKPPKINLWGDMPSLDVSTTTVKCI